jgi:hypothetical protein
MSNMLMQICAPTGWLPLTGQLNCRCCDESQHAHGHFFHAPHCSNFFRYRNLWASALCDASGATGLNGKAHSSSCFRTLLRADPAAHHLPRVRVCRKERLECEFGNRHIQWGPEDRRGAEELKHAFARNQ